MSLQNLIVDNFSRAVPTYDDYGYIQAEAANRLADDVRRQMAMIPQGEILELGCGTGFFSMPLVSIFGDRHVEITDISEPMLEKCKQRLLSYLGSIPPSTSLSLLDAHQFEQVDRYALIGCSFTLQWVTNVSAVIERILKSLKPGGVFFFSVPGNKSFPEWRQLCLEAGIPFTANTLPSVAQFKEVAANAGYPISVYEEVFTVTAPSALHFFKGLKALGASTALHGKRLSVSEMRALLKLASERHPDSFPITYQVVRGRITRN